MYAVRTEILQRLCILINNKMFVVELWVTDNLFYANEFGWVFLRPLKWTGNILKFSVQKIIIFLSLKFVFLSNHLKFLILLCESYFLRSNESLLQCFLKTQLCCAVVNLSFIFHILFFFPHRASPDQVSLELLIMRLKRHKPHKKRDLSK